MREPKRLTITELTVGQEVRIYDGIAEASYKARVLATDVKGPNPIVLASLSHDDKSEDIETADLYGFVSSHEYIIAIPEFFECWINVYEGSDPTIHYTKDSSDLLVNSDTFIKTIHVKEEI